MVIDTSALVAIILGEPERWVYSRVIRLDQRRLASAATLVETTMVILGRKGEAGVMELQAFLRTTEIETAAFSSDHIAFAVDAFRRFGKGRHPAALNLGDCFSYALARATDEPLLFKGDDFARTDIKRVM